MQEDIVTKEDIQIIKQGIDDIYTRLSFLVILGFVLIFTMAAGTSAIVVLAVYIIIVFGVLMYPLKLWGSK